MAVEVLFGTLSAVAAVMTVAVETWVEMAGSK
jgi:hypothetical protein